MTLEEAEKIRDFIEGIEESKEFLDFIKNCQGEHLRIYVNNPIYGGIYKNVPKTIAEALVTLTETIIVSLEEQLKNL